MNEAYENRERVILEVAQKIMGLIKPLGQHEQRAALITAQTLCEYHSTIQNLAELGIPSGVTQRIDDPKDEK